MTGDEPTMPVSMGTTKSRNRYARRFRRIRGVWAALHAVALLIAAAAPAAAAPIREIHYVMGTYFSIAIDELAEREARPLMRRCFRETRRLEDVFSRYDASSELSRINARVGNGPIEASADLADLLARSLELRQATGGAFDVTIGAWTPLGDAADGDVRRAAGHPHAGERARLSRDSRIVLAPGVQLDFDGIAKGYAVDRCVALLRAGGVRRALLSFGESSQYALGAPMGAAAWTVAVRDLGGDRALGILALRNQALSVSSAFTRERHAAHIIDPSSGEPVREPSAAVVVTTSATDAEAWSKALLVRGERRPRLPGFPAALYITPHGVEPAGVIAFTAYPSPPGFGADAEPFL